MRNSVAAKQQPYRSGPVSGPIFGCVILLCTLAVVGGYVIYEYVSHFSLAG
jgi:hypothetical protein